MKILIKNANLISMDLKREKYEENIDILIVDGKIEKIEKNIVEDNVEKIIDAKEKVVMPGLINTHAHLPMSIFRETLDGYGLQEWLEDKIWPMEDKLTEEDIYYATYLSCIEMIKTGCTTINDMYFMVDYIIKAVLETGVRLQTSRALLSIGLPSDDRLSELKRLLESYKEYGTISFNAGIHGLYTTSKEDLEKYIDFANQNNLLIHMHFCENTKEVEDIKKMHNVATPMELINKYFTRNKLVLAHAVKLSDSEIDELSKLKDVSISHCPVSNLKLGCGIAKISQMMKNGINISLGTDGQGSGSNLDMFEVMKLTALLQKGANESAKELPAYEVLKMATINGAKALGLEKKIGSIEKGKEADLIIIDMISTITQPLNDIFSDIVYNVKGTDVDTTIVKGKILMENKKLEHVDERKIFEKCKKIINRIK